MGATRDRTAWPRRSWPQRLLIAFNALLLVGCTTAAGAIGYLAYRIGDIPSVELAEDVLDDPAADDDPGPARNYLLVGSDTREGQDAESFGTSDDAAGGRADTIMLVRVDPRAARASMVSFPRDLDVPVFSASGQELGTDRINTAFAGGPEQLIMTIRRNFDVPVHHFAQVSFAGFRDLVDAVGGVDVYLAGPVRDRDSEGLNKAALDIDATGCVTLTGDQALAYVRSRHFEQLVDGSWQIDRRADLDRIVRQQDFVRRAVRAALREGLTNPASLTRLVDVADDNILIDDRLTTAEIVDVGRRFRTLTPETLDQRELVVEDITAPSGARKVRLVDTPANEDVLRVFRGEATAPTTSVTSTVAGDPPAPAQHEQAPVPDPATDC